MGVCGLSSGRPCPFALRVWQAWADRWPPLSIPLQSNTVTGFSSAVDLATASQQSRLALGLLNRRVMKSSAAHMIIKALTLGGLSEALHPSPICHWCSQSSTRIVIRYTVLWKTTVVRRKESYNSFQSSFFWGRRAALNLRFYVMLASEVYLVTVSQTSVKLSHGEQRVATQSWITSVTFALVLTATKGSAGPSAATPLCSGWRFPSPQASQGTFGTQVPSGPRLGFERCGLQF